MFINICYTAYTPFISTFFQNIFVLTYGNRDSCPRSLKSHIFLSVAVWTAAMAPMLKVPRKHASSGIFSDAMLLEPFHSPVHISVYIRFRTVIRQ